jgi:hypothetical protein
MPSYQKLIEKFPKVDFSQFYSAVHISAEENDWMKEDVSGF